MNGTLNTMTINDFYTASMSRKHGSLFDRGSADSYYHRPRNPHWYPAGTYNDARIDTGLTPEQIAEYNAGYDESERFGLKKEW